MLDPTRLALQLGCARVLRVSTEGATAEARAPGGGLAGALDRGAARAALGLLAEGERLVLEDGELAVSLDRRRYEGVQRVLIGGRLVLEELLDLERPRPSERAARPCPGPGELGAASFRARHGLRAAYAAGPLPQGVSGPALVSALARAGLLGFIGSTGLDLEAIRGAVASVAALAQGWPAGVALPQHGEERRAQEELLSLARLLDLRHVHCWATTPPTPELVRFRASGLSRGPDGSVRARHHLFVAVSNLDAAEPWLRPPSGEILDLLLARGQISEAERALAARAPVADELVAEGHAGGRTERWPLMALLPCLLRRRARAEAAEGYEEGLRTHVGAAGELGDPASLHAAFALGADFVVTGTLNATTVEAATSLRVKEMLAEAGVADCRTAPAADRFETGGRVQVLSRGTRFPQHAEHLYDVYRRYRGLDEIPEGERRLIERSVLHRPIADIWAEIEADLRERRPVEAQLALEDPRHRMALVFRWYLDMSARWAVAGSPGRVRDYQVWCGPAVGLFNDWVKGTWLEPLAARKVVAVADALLDGAASLRGPGA